MRPSSEVRQAEGDGSDGTQPGVPAPPPPPPSKKKRRLSLRLETGGPSAVERQAHQSIQKTMSITRTPFGGGAGAAGGTGAGAGIDPNALVELENSLKEYKRELGEKERSLESLESKLADKERDLWETEALLKAREKIVQARSLKNEQQRGGALSDEEKEALEQMKKEMDEQERRIEAARAELEERESFLEQSEEMLMVKVQEQQEQAMEIEHRLEVIQSKEAELGIDSGTAGEEDDAL